jgi:hypothetical protein
MLVLRRITLPPPHTHTHRHTLESMRMRVCLRNEMFESIYLSLYLYIHISIYIRFDLNPCMLRVKINIYRHGVDHELHILFFFHSLPCGMTMQSHPRQCMRPTKRTRPMRQDQRTAARPTMNKDMAHDDARPTSRDHVSELPVTARAFLPEYNASTLTPFRLLPVSKMLTRLYTTARPHCHPHSDSHAPPPSSHRHAAIAGKHATNAATDVVGTSRNILPLTTLEAHFEPFEARGGSIPLSTLYATFLCPSSMDTIHMSDLIASLRHHQFSLRSLPRLPRQATTPWKRYIVPPGSDTFTNDMCDHASHASHVPLHDATRTFGRDAAIASSNATTRMMMMMPSCTCLDRLDEGIAGKASLLPQANESLPPSSSSSLPSSCASKIMFPCDAPEMCPLAHAIIVVSNKKKATSTHGGLSAPSSFHHGQRRTHVNAHGSETSSPSFTSAAAASSSSSHAFLLSSLESVYYGGEEEREEEKQQAVASSSSSSSSFLMS